MQKLFWFAIIVTAGMVVGSSAAIAQTQPVPPTAGKRPEPHRFDLAPQKSPTSTILGSPRVPATTQPRIYRRDRDRNHDRDRYRANRYRSDSTPHGWSKGKKKGWGNCDVPPGQAKKVGCTPDNNWRNRDRYDRRGRGHKK